ncbi:UNVERIFIED_CONTAM: hypothetical protein Sangu_3186700 [Sesamum angustifolium]|uniref:Uncharacterized protein n=1 Tax=Sesamum angustifolium TaxID=2727405 RepID=A0AAW2JNG6_9LAMI
MTDPLLESTVVTTLLDFSATMRRAISLLPGMNHSTASDKASPLLAAISRRYGVGLHFMLPAFTQDVNNDYRS